MKNKFLVFALVLTLLVPCFGGSVAYASEGYPNDLPSLPQIEAENIKYVLFYFDNVLYCYAIDNSLPVNDVVFAVDSNFTEIYFYCSSKFNVRWYYYDDNAWKISGTHYDLNRDYTNPFSVSCSTGISFVYSESDIYNIDTGEVVFRKPSVPLGIPGGTLTQAITQENPLNQILTLLPMVIVCLVGYVGLRKALATLRTALRKA